MNLLNEIAEGERRKAVSGKKYYKTIQVNGNQVRLHRHLMEQHLGRKLTYNEVVHHIDEDIYNNDLSNLQVVSRADHIRMHPKTIELSAIAKTLYSVNKELLIDLYKVKRLTIKVISEIVKVPQVTLFRIIERYQIVRDEIFCNCGAKLKFSKTMMCERCRKKFNSKKKCLK